MFNLLTAEKIKLLRSKKVWIVLGLFVIIPIYQALESKSSSLKQVLETVVNGATGILMMEKNGFAILLIVSAFISFFIGEEFQNGTIRNVLSLGRSRTQYYLTKLAVASLLAVVGILIMTALGIVTYTSLHGFGEVAGIHDYFSYAFKAFGTLLLLILANVSIYVMISFQSKSSAVSLIWSFLYTIATGFGAGIFLQTEHFKFITFWFTEAFLFYSDFANPAEISLYPRMVLVSLLTIVISSTIGILLFKRTDIK
ncbi:ABC transporter permease [Paenibacillus pasadenensis]|uniref:ABC transporter permease n=1 Tax=Paenibacillus pasadenensis TaxID=217090 RepID=UPI00203C36FD|nr:ABC transporter permease [Paenibacillus pasadenensis]MCM3745867.1 ABC transporter permease [Paenibacillus pasadenensis]